ncbi:MAG: T9SS type B sorting domain-containing protein [Bacteroidota bacterium]
MKFKVLFVVLFQFAFTSGLFANSTKETTIKFIENKNQWPKQVNYRARFNFGEVYLESNSFTYTFFEPKIGNILHNHDTANVKDDASYKLHSVRINFIGANQNVKISSENKSKEYYNFYIGKNSSQWASEAYAYNDIYYKELYAGIDLHCYSTDNKLKYDYTIKPSADVSQIKLKYSGFDKLEIVNDELLIYTSVGIIKETKPFAYQLIDGQMQIVACNYKLNANTLSFEFPDGYNKNYEVIIDPTLIFASFTGSTADNWGFSATYDNAGNAYAGGIAFFTGYPITIGAFQTSFSGVSDIAISKFSAGGNSLLYSTYLGGTSNDQPHSLVVDDNNQLFVFGRTSSADYPVTTGAFDVSYNGMYDIIISKFNESGTQLSASTYVGGTSDDAVNHSSDFLQLANLKYNYSDDARGEIVCDAQGNVYIASCTTSINFPVTSGSFQQTPSLFQEGCVFKLNNSLSILGFSSYLGGNSNDAAYGICIAPSGEIIVAGGTQSTNLAITIGALQNTFGGGRADGFIYRISANGSTILSSTYIGTNKYDQIYFVQIDGDNDVYVYGQTDGAYPVSANVYNNPNSGQFIHKLNLNLNTTIYSTVFGKGNSLPNISPTAFLVDRCENVYCAGWGGTLGGANNSWSTTIGLPVTPDAHKATTNSDDLYFFVLRKNADALAYASFFGGVSSKEHVDGGTCRFDKNGIAYQAVCGGCGGFSDMPTTPGVVSNTNNSSNCNYGMIKFRFDLTETLANYDFVSDTLGCAPYLVNFDNRSFGYETLEWDFGDGEGSHEVSPSHTFEDPGVYDVKLIAFNPHSCNERDTIIKKIYVNAPFTTTSVKQKTICKGDTIELDATYTDALTYTWLPETDVFPSNDLAIVKVAPQLTTTFSVKIFDGVCAVTDVFTVTVTEPFTYTPVEDRIICTGTTTTLSVDYPPATSYKWFKNNSQTPFETNSTIIVSPTISTTYLVIVSDGICKVSDVSTVTVFNPIQINPIGEKKICIGDSVSLDVTNINALSYSWLPQNAVAPNHTQSLVRVAPNINSTFSVTIFDGVCTITDVATVTVGSPFSINPIGVKNICRGNSVSLNATNNNAISYNWQPSNLVLPSNNVAIVTVSPTTLTTYKVELFDGYCKVTDIATVTVKNPFVITPMLDKSICLGDTVSFDVTNPNVFFYSWSPANLVKPSATSSVVKLIPTTSTVFSLSMSDNLCVVNDDVLITVNRNSNKITPSGLVKLCADSSVVLDAGADLQSYLWNNGSVERYFPTNKKGKYSVATIDFNGCKATDFVEVIEMPRVNITAFSDTLVCADLPVKLSAIGATSYTWAPVTYLKNTTGSSVISIPKTSIDYIVTGMVENCVDYDTLNVTVAAQSNIELGDDFFVRAGEEVQLNAQTDSLIEWYPSDKLSCKNCLSPIYIADSAKVFYATSANYLGCISTDSVKVFVDYDSSVYLPNCFTPNQSGLNDVYKVVTYGVVNYSMKIFNRWGALVYQWTDAEIGWDGTYKGALAKQDVYAFIFEGRDVKNKLISISGNITLIR